MVKRGERVAPGLIKLGPYGPYRNCVWLFHHGTEAAVMEMPPYREKRDARPWRAVRRELAGLDASLKYGLLSHAHIDHCQTLVPFRNAFPKARFVAHVNQAYSTLVARLAWSGGTHQDRIFDEVFSGQIRLLELAGEPLILIHAPKHSESDLLILFRGTAMTGDWYLGDLKDCNALVSPEAKIAAIETVQSWLERLNYRVERAFSSHGDCLYYRCDFDRLLEQSKVDHDRESAYALG